MKKEMPRLMASSMKDYCQVIAPFLPSTLVNSEALSRIYEITQSLPPFFTTFLECRLAENEPRVDFLADVRHGTLSIPEKFLQHPLWQDIEILYQDWTKPTSFLHKTINNLCLEFDLEADSQGSEILVPCLFFGLNQNAMNEVNILTKILTYLPSSLLVNQPNSKQFELNLQQCIDNLPQDALIAHLGLMLSRSTQEVRLHIKGIPALQIPTYLKQIGWKRKTDQLTNLIETLSGFVDYLTLDLDIGDQIGFQIGLECYFKNQPPDESRWFSFLEHLVTQELCTSAKKDALLA